MAKKNVWDINFAENSKVRDRVSNFFCSKLRVVRDEREELEQKWLEFFRMWNVEKDSGNTYNGRSKLYIPEVRKNIEAQARQMTESAFPNDDFLSCYPGKTGTFEGAEIQRYIRLWQIRQAKLRLKYHVFCRQQVMLGTSTAFIPWRLEKQKIWMSSKVNKKIIPKRQEIEIYNGPDFVPVDLFKWYALNSLKDDFMEDGCVEFKLEDQFELIAKNKRGELWNYADLKSTSTDALSKTELERYVEKVEASGLILERGGSAGAASFRMKESDASDRVLCGTIYTTLELPEACMEDEDKSVPIPVKIQIYNDNHVGLVKRNPFFFQTPPYVAGKYIPSNIDEFYGQGIPWAIQYMQHEMNSKAEQGMDSATLALNPLTFINPALAGNMGDFEVQPGAIWWVDPNGVKMATIPDVTPIAYQAIAQLRGQMADYSDRSPALPPQLMGKSRTATQAELVGNALSVDIKAFQIQNEISVLNPTMSMWESLTDQNIEDNQIVMMYGDEYQKAKRILVEKNKTLGRYEYEWRASSVTNNRQILARQLIDFMKIVSTLPPQEKAAMNLRIDELAKMLFREGFNLPNYNKVFGVENMESTDPATELKMVKEGMDIEVLPGDNDDVHMAEHDKNLKDKELSEEQVAQLTVHIAQHAAQKQMKLEAARIKAQQEQMQMMMAQQQMGKPGSGNRTQLSPNANTADMASGVRA